MENEPRCALPAVAKRCIEVRTFVPLISQSWALRTYCTVRGAEICTRSPLLLSLPISMSMPPPPPDLLLSPSQGRFPFGLTERKPGTAAEAAYYACGKATRMGEAWVDSKWGGWRGKEEVCFGIPFRRRLWIKQGGEGEGGGERRRRSCSS